MRERSVVSDGARAEPAAGVRHQPRILVAGLGNALMGDDGVGVHVCRALRAERPGPHHYLVAEVGTAIYAALHLLEWADRVLVVDAMCAGGPPGSLYLAHERDIEVKPVGASLHDLGLVGALSLLASRRPREVQVLGIEPQVLAPGEALSAPVAAAMPGAVEWAKRILHEQVRPLTPSAWAARSGSERSP